MTKSALLTILLPAFLLLTQAKADVVTATLPEYTGPYYDFSASFPIASTTIGTFTYVIPAGQSILGATVSGTFGNTDVANSTALSDYYVAGVAVASCSDFNNPCFNAADPYDAPQAWSYNFTTAQLSGLSSGSAVYSVVENSPFQVQTGVTTLTITTTPEPAFFALIGAGLVTLAFARRTRKDN